MPQLAQPRNILDLLNYQLYMIESASSMNVTRLCEGDFGITRREWRFLAILAASGPLSPSELAARGVDAGCKCKRLATDGRVSGQPVRLDLPLFHGRLRAEVFSPFDQHRCRVIHRRRGACHADADGG